ncbi:MAG: hypothetical protein ACRD3I_03530 [Terriglobales bacterium]
MRDKSGSKKELASDRLWDEAFAKSQEKLAALADQALLEHDRGKTKPLSDLLTSHTDMDDESRNQ